MTKPRIVQPSVAKRIAFATWARKEGINRRSSATFLVPSEVEVPAALLAGAQVDGEPYQEAPRRTRTRKRKDMGTVEEPAPPLPQTVADDSRIVDTTTNGADTEVSINEQTQEE